MNPVPCRKVALAVLLDVVIGAVLLAVLSMTVDRPTSTGPDEVLVDVPETVSTGDGPVGDTTTTGAPPVPVTDV